MKVKVPPIKIQGIKTKLIPFINENLPNVTNKTWIEPFLGSGVVGFNLAGEKAIFSDSNPYTIQFYQDIKDKKITSEIVKEFLEIEGVKLKEKDADYFYEVRNRFNETHQSLDFLFLNRSDFNGMIRFNKNGGFNVPYGHKPNRFEKSYITKVFNQVKWVEEKIWNNDWEFHCKNFKEALKNLNENTFIYLDPPYIGRNVDYYNSWTIEDEQSLYDILMKEEKPFLLSTWDHDDYKTNTYLNSLWKDFDKVTTEHMYQVAANTESRRPVVEALLKGFF